MAAFEVSVPELNKVVQSIAPEQTLLRVSEENNAWVLLRDGSVRCKVTARVERTRGMLHLAVSLCNCDPAQQLLLPLEIRATCEGTPLHCVSASQALDLLYQPDRKRDPYSDEQLSFASVSEQDEYLIPTNYRQLEATLQERKMVSMPIPGLASIPGEVYPGPHFWVTRGHWAESCCSASCLRPANLKRRDGSCSAVTFLRTAAESNLKSTSEMGLGNWISKSPIEHAEAEDILTRAADRTPPPCAVRRRCDRCSDLPLKSTNLWLG